eukprot:1574835-Prorocentrum_lima.AAC.1
MGASIEPDKAARLWCPQLAVAKQTKSLLPWPKITPSQPVAGPIQLYAAGPYWFPELEHWEPD